MNVAKSLPSDMLRWAREGELTREAAVANAARHGRPHDLPDLEGAHQRIRARGEVQGDLRQREDRRRRQRDDGGALRAVPVTFHF